MTQEVAVADTVAQDIGPSGDQVAEDRDTLVPVSVLIQQMGQLVRGPGVKGTRGRVGSDRVLGLRRDRMGQHSSQDVVDPHVTGMADGGASEELDAGLPVPRGLQGVRQQHQARRRPGLGIGVGGQSVDLSRVSQPARGQECLAEAVADRVGISDAGGGDDRPPVPGTLARLLRTSAQSSRAATSADDSGGGMAARAPDRVRAKSVEIEPRFPEGGRVGGIGDRGIGVVRPAAPDVDEVLQDGTEPVGRVGPSDDFGEERPARARVAPSRASASASWACAAAARAAAHFAGSVPAITAPSRSSSASRNARSVARRAPCAARPGVRRRHPR